MRIFLLVFILQISLLEIGQGQIMYRILGGPPGGIIDEYQEIGLIRYDSQNGIIDTLVVAAPEADRDLGFLYKRGYASSLSFHPNGKLLMLGYHHPTIEINLKTGRSRWLTGTPIVPFPIDIEDQNVRLFGSPNEYGEIIFSSYEDIQSYDILTGEIKTLKEGNYDHIFSFYKNRTLIRRKGLEEIVIYDPDTEEEEPLFSIEDNMEIYGCSRYYDEDHRPHLILNIRDWMITNRSHYLDLDLTTMASSVIEGSSNLPRGGTFHPVTTTRCFRHNGYMVSLDSDRSSGHYTGGYYDTAFVCHPVASIADEDIRFDLGGQKIDSITFQLLGPKPTVIREEALEYDHPDVVQVNQKRWRWINPRSDADYATAKTLLHDIKYVADWEEGQSTERIVGVTTYLQGDSTVSWSVIQLADTGHMAGPDLDLTLCDAGGRIDLSKEMHPGTSKKGRLVPGLSAGTLSFDPQKDEPGEYMYIIEGRECADTAFWVLTLQEIEPLTVKDTLVCRDDVVTFQTSPALYDSILWRDGSREAAFTTSETGDFWLKAWKGNCQITDTFRMEEHPEDNLIYDLIPNTLSSCAGEQIEWDLTEYNPDAIWIEGERITGQVIRDHFSPGSYEVILEKGKCRHEGDLEIIYTAFDEGTQTLPADTVFCPREESMIDLGDYFSEAVWTDGFPHTRRLIRESGTYGYSASREGCILTDSLHVVMEDQCTECNVTFPNAFSPNGDGQNDSFEVFSPGCHKVEGIRIYDRWGNLMIDSPEDSIPSSRFETFSAGVYLVIVEVSDSWGDRIRKQSTLHLLR